MFLFIHHALSAAAAIRHRKFSRLVVALLHKSKFTQSHWMKLKIINPIRRTAHSAGVGAAAARQVYFILCLSTATQTAVSFVHAIVMPKLGHLIGRLLFFSICLSPRSIFSFIFVSIFGCLVLIRATFVFTCLVLEMFVYFSHIFFRYFCVDVDINLLDTT